MPTLSQRADSRTGNGLLPQRAWPSAGALFAALLCSLWLAVSGSGQAVAWIITAVVPGLAMLPFLPTAGRRSTPLAISSALIASLCFWALVIPLISAVGVRVGQVSVLGSATLACVLSLAVSLRWGEIATAAKRPVLDWAAIAVIAVPVAAVSVINFSSPPIGFDWGHYWLFADTLVASGSLDTPNPIWMGGGTPFGDYPGIPSLMATWLTLSGLKAANMPGLILYLYAAGVLSVWLTTRAWWGSLSAACAGFLAALLPPTVTTIGWSGLAHLASMIFLPPLVGCAAALGASEGRERRRLQVSFAALAATCAAVQPLTAIVAFATVALIFISSAVGSRGRSLKTLAQAAAFSAVFATPIAIDYVNRLGKLGVVADYKNFLSTRIKWEETLTNGLLPATIVGLSLAGIAVAAARQRSRPLAVGVGFSILVCIAYSQLWQLQIAGEYRRAVFIAAPMLAIGFGGLGFLVRMLNPIPRAAVLLLVGAGITVTLSQWPQANVNYYGTVTAKRAAAVEFVGLQAQSASESIVTDSCWAFPTLGLTRAAVYGALEPQQIGPQAEVAPARLAALIIGGRDRGFAIADRLRVGWSLYDPRCPQQLKTPTSSGVPPGFTPVLVSERLIVGRRTSNPIPSAMTTRMKP